ncbi:alpha-amylase family glycosyl hydrolase [uncultured Prevotella sp.]|uniref:alpha-amylase family glycosyl hydrolase n=1 Tax=uncultured Prevotella sp. TaxID=159272 RepID=UPI0027DE8429|nr:alpha-amylase family glycosyl hydrolase [uncultured Prevotella sp.]
MNKKLITAIAAIACPSMLMAQGWPTNHQGVMLQGFYWNSYDATNWKKLETQADELSKYFNLIWIPQSGNCGGESMGYDDLYWFDNYKSAFGSEEELRSMISTFKQKGLGTIADVVINHRKTLTNWVDFPKETYKGVTYQLLPTDICKDDCSGKTATWAKENGYNLSDNNDTGEGVDFARDLDHNSSNVQNNVKAYLDFLLNDLGYSGVRYDMVKGYDAKFTGIYNTAAKPAFSVGEYFDGNKQNVENWINGTTQNGEIQSAAFDFPTRYAVRNATAYSNWTKLDNGGLATDGDYCRYAVTFVENHDTEKRSESEQQDPIKKDTLAANAYILAMPGTPCVFMKHWIDHKREIKNMILLRNLTGITNQSAWNRNVSTVARYVFTTTGTNGRLHVAVGTSANSYTADNTTWALATEGYHYRYFLERNRETAWIDLPSGEYHDTPKALLRAISTNDNAKIVYTLDGTAPTANSSVAESGYEVALPEGDVTLKAGLLVDGNVTGITERHYSIKAFSPYAITVNVNADQVGWTAMNVWSWGGDGSHNPTIQKWPGDNVTTTVTENGKTWYSLGYTMNSVDDYVNFVFSTDNGKSQTENIQNVNATTYLEITTEKDSNGHYKVADVTSQYSGIAVPSTAIMPIAKSTTVVSLDGRTLRSFSGHVSAGEATQGLPSGIYIVNGKKAVK